MAYTLSNKCAKNLCKRNGQFYFNLSSKTWSHVFFGTQCITSEAPTDMKFYYQWRING